MTSQSTEHIDASVLTSQSTEHFDASVLTSQCTEHFDADMLTSQSTGHFDASVLTFQSTEHFDANVLTFQIGIQATFDSVTNKSRLPKLAMNPECSNWAPSQLSSQRTMTSNALIVGGIQSTTHVQQLSDVSSIWLAKRSLFANLWI